MEKWFVKNKQADFQAIAQKLGISQCFARLLVNRDMVHTEDMELYMRPKLKDMHAPFAMKDMEKACKILKQKMEEGKRIRIVGDYDVDGVMSVFILYKGLLHCGARIDYEIPDRIRDGYGMNESIIERAYEAGIDTILTCDNGIAAVEPVAYAKSLGMTVIITDHHEVFCEEKEGGKQYRIPVADAVVNPRQEDCSYPYPHICGAFIAYKLIQGFDEKYQAGIRPKESLTEYAAIATICDVMEVIDENRIIVKNGIKALKNTNNMGLSALIEVTGINRQKLGTYHIGYVLGPCINASGRLMTAKKALELLMSGSEEEALTLAKELKELNEERKQMTNQGVEEGTRMIEEGGFLEDKVLVIYLPECHESLAGIIAGRLRERYERPVLVLTRGETKVKGSGRSIEGYSMYEKLCECGELLEKFGGHPMAAGFSLAEENIEKLREKLNSRSGLKEEDLVTRVSFDMVLPLMAVSEDLIEECEGMEPFGKGNPKPLFGVKNVIAVSVTAMGASKQVLRIMLKEPESNRIYQAVLFQKQEIFDGYLAHKIGKTAVEALYEGRGGEVFLDIIYRAEWNEYRGEKKMQIVIEHYR